VTPLPGRLAPIRPLPAPASGAERAWLWELEGCATDARGRRFLEALRAMLARVAPAQVDPSQTLALGSPAALHAVIPHRALGGAAVVARLRDTRVDVGWVVLRTLVLPVDVSRGTAWSGPFELDRSEVGLAEAVGCAERELRRPLEVRLVRRGGSPEPSAVEVWLEQTLLLRRRRLQLAALNPFAERTTESAFVTLAGPAVAPVAMYTRSGWVDDAG